MSSIPPVPLALRSVERVYAQGRDWRLRRKRPIQAVAGVSLAVGRGQTLGIVGESGCGKSTLARMMVGLLSPTAGDILIDGRPIGDYSPLTLHRKAQMVFQDPLGSLNPRRSIRQILETPLQRLRGMEPARRRTRILELMALVSLREEFLDRYPHEFSGGQCQRIGIARALAAEPEIIVLDEPVSALDVSVQAQVLALLIDLQERLGASYVFISHDLAVVESIASEVCVMQAGKVVEQASTNRLFLSPQHAYTRELLASIPGNATASPAQ